MTVYSTFDKVRKLNGDGRAIVMELAQTIV